MAQINLEVFEHTFGNTILVDRIEDVPLVNQEGFLSVDSTASSDIADTLTLDGIILDIQDGFLGVDPVEGNALAESLMGDQLHIDIQEGFPGIDITSQPDIEDVQLDDGLFLDNVELPNATNLVELLELDDELCP